MTLSPENDPKFELVVHVDDAGNEVVEEQSTSNDNDDNDNE